jgi:hypothetical protein
MRGSYAAASYIDNEGKVCECISRRRMELFGKSFIHIGAFSRVHGGSRASVSLCVTACIGAVECLGAVGLQEFPACSRYVQ